MATSKSKKVKKNKKEIDPVQRSLDRLKMIKPPAKPPQRMQFYEPETGKFGYAVGSEGDCVYLLNNGRIQACANKYRTKLHKNLAMKYVKPHDVPDGQRIWREIKNMLRKYLWFHDERMYSMLQHGLWEPTCLNALDITDTSSFTARSLDVENLNFSN